MITGLTVTVPAIELRELCRKQAGFQHGRADAYRNQLRSMDEHGIDGANPGTFQYSGHQDPREPMRNKLTEHENAARELEFIASHLADDDYRLDRSDLMRLGIIRTNHDLAAFLR